MLDSNEILQHQDRNVSFVETHPNYEAPNVHYDYALLLLHNPFDLQDHIDIICLPNPNEDFTGRRCTVTGWGQEEMSIFHFFR